MLWDSVMPDTLQWEVALRDVYRRDGTVIPGKKEIFRIDNDEHYGVVGSNYTPLQNAECAAFIATLGGCSIEKAGVFGGGAKVWWAIRLPGDLYIAGDVLHRYSIMVNAHDGTLGFRWFITPIRPWCSNMINMLIHSAIDFNISARHTVNINARVTEAAKAFEHVNTVYDELQTAYTVMANQRFDGSFIGYVEAVLQPEDVEHGRFKTAMAKMYENLENDPCNGTRWGALNAVTQYLDHQRPMRGEHQNARRFENALYGTTAKLKQRAYHMMQEGPNGPNYLTYISNGVERPAAALDGDE